MSNPTKPNDPDYWRLVRVGGDNPFEDNRFEVVPVVCAGTDLPEWATSFDNAPILDQEEITEEKDA